MSRLRWFVVPIVVGAMVLAACGGDDDDSATSTSAGGSGNGELTDSFRGVTADTIKLGIVLVDYDCIAQFVDFNRGDQQAVYDAYVADVNENGGVLGRQIEPVYETYCPIGNAEALEVCTKLTQDEEVFAVTGVFIDFSGDAQLCLSRDNETVHIGRELERAWIEEAPPGLLVTPQIAAERRIEVLMNLLETEGSLEDKTVAVMSDDDTAARAEAAVIPALDELGVDQGSTAVITVTDANDTAAGQAQLDSFIEKWKQEDVDTIVLVGLSIVSRQWVEKIKDKMPDVQLLADTPTSTLEAARDAQHDNPENNAYEGLITADGRNGQETYEALVDDGCVKIAEDATGETVVAPEELKPGTDGKRTELWITVSDACTDLWMFRDIAEKAGADLTNDSWAEAVEGFGEITIPGQEFSSFGPDKYDAEDGFRLVEYDPTIGDDGDWAAITEIENTAAE
jgi:Periplasmic binding protein